MHIIYILFLTSGIIKSFFPYYHIELPLDLTLILAAVLVADIAFFLINNKFRINYNFNSIITFILLIIFYMYMIVSISYTPSESYSLLKTKLFLTNICAFAYPVLRNNVEYKKYFRVLIPISIILSLWLLPFMLTYLKSPDQYRNTVLYDMMGTSLSIGNLLGFCLLIVLTVKKLYKSDIVKWITVILLFVILMVTGARGPLLFFLLLYFIYIVYSLIKGFYSEQKYPFTLLLNSIFFAGILMALLFFIILQYSESFNILVDRTFDRFSVLATDDMGESISERMHYLDFSIDKISDNSKNFIFGYGIGSFGIMSNGVDVKDYPHNIILELFFELGFVGLLLFVLFFVSALYKSNFRSDTGITSVILIFLVLNAMKSSSLVDHRLLFFILAIHQMIKKEEEQRT